MPVTRKRTTRLQQQPQTGVTSLQEDLAGLHNNNNHPTVPQGEEDHVATSSSPTSTTRSKKKFRHKRNRSINRATIPLGASTKVAKLVQDIAASNSSTPTPTTTTTPLGTMTRWKSTATTTTTTTSKRIEPQSSAFPFYSIRPMQMHDVAAVYHLGNAIFTATEYPNMYRTWDDFAVVENYEGSGEFCFVVVVVKEQEEAEAKAKATMPMLKKKNDNNNKKNDNKKKEEMIIGFLLGETVTKAAIGTRGYIQWVAVLPEYRRLGIATALIQQFTTVAREQDVTLLIADTPADNEPAIRLFEKAGLCFKTDHVYLTCQLRDVELVHVDEDMTFNFAYTAKKKRITIRNMEIDDLYPIHAIGDDIFTKKSANLYNFWDEHLVLQSYLSDPEFCVVATVKEHDQDKVVGFAFGTTIEKPRSSWKYGYLVWLGCARECQGMGLATQLYNVMLELFALEKVRMVMIDTQHNNEGALNFFRKAGFGQDEDHVYLSNAPMDD